MNLTLTDQELEQLLNELESDRVERKASYSDPEKIKQAICAFANDLPGHGKPGVLFVGFTDNGNCANLTIDDELLLKLSSIQSSGEILPRPAMTVQKRKIRDCEMGIITVAPSEAPPVRYKGKVWLRVGPSRCLAGPSEERILTERRRWADAPFDCRPVAGSAIDDLDIEFFVKTYLKIAIAEEVLLQNSRPIEQKLSSLRFLSRANEPNYGAIIIFGRNPLQFVPCAHIQFVRFDGIDLTSPIKDEKDLFGPLYEVLPLLDELIDINISTAIDIFISSVESKTPDYPVGALRQLARNAIMHRAYEGTNAPIRIYWFADRIEIHNPGGLYGQVNEANFGKGATDYRNPLIAEAMRTLGYVQRFGMGIPLAVEELRKNGNPPPVFDFQPNSFLATIKKIK